MSTPIQTPSGVETPDPLILAGMGEFFAAGYFEEPDATPMRRWSRAARRRFEQETPPPYNGEPLYPSGRARTSGENVILRPNYSFTWEYSDAKAAARLEDAQGNQRETLTALRAHMRAESRRLDAWRTRHLVGGAGYTHSIPNYGRVLREGLHEHGRRIEAGLEKARGLEEEGRIDFYLGLQDVLAGIQAWHARLLETLEDWDGLDETQRRNRDRLVGALGRVPFGPAGTFFEAIAAYNLTFYLDDCDNPGRIDQELGEFYERDVEEGRSTREEALALVRRFTDNVCARGGWSAAIGGTRPDGGPGYNKLTQLCIEAVHHRHRPNYELRVRDDMPDAVWDAALDALATGCGQPALYNEGLYLAGLREDGLGVAEKDLCWWNGGGCTETMVHGRSNVGSLDAGIHLPLVLEATLAEHLPAATSFGGLVDAFKTDIARTVAEIVDDVNRKQRSSAACRPQPMRSLLIDDCIDSGIEFNAGGARYNWSVVNVAGLANVADSLAAVREVVFEKRERTGEELLAALAGNFEGKEPFRRRLARCPRFGNDDPRVDELAADVATSTFQEFRRHTPWRGGRFLPSCIMFEVYGPEGARLGATPDGRLAGEPLADSIGPYQGRDTHGPTAMLKSVTRLPLHMALGTPIVNIRFSGDLFTTREHRSRLRELIQTFFHMGGMQIQISVVDQEVLRDAIAHPERHQDLIVRIGGYSTYFNWLSPELKQAVLARSEHGA